MNKRKNIKKAGRKKINLDHVFNDVKYLSILFLMLKCQHYDKKIQLLHMRYALVKNHGIAPDEIYDKKLDVFFNIPDNFQYSDEYKQQWKKKINDFKNQKIISESLYRYGLKLTEQNIIEETIRILYSHWLFRVCTKYEKGNITKDELDKMVVIENKDQTSFFNNNKFDNTNQLMKYLNNLKYELKMIDNVKLRKRKKPFWIFTPYGLRDMDKYYIRVLLDSCENDQFDYVKDTVMFLLKPQ